MKYVFVDTDNGGTPSNATPDTSTSIYHTSSSWPANGARWSSLGSALANATVQGITDDLTVYCIGAADDTTTGITLTGLTAASLLIQGDFAAAAPSASSYLVKVTGTAQRLLTHNKASMTATLRGLQMSHLGTSTTNNTAAEITVAATLNVDSCYIIVNGSSTSIAYGLSVGGSASASLNAYNTIVDVKSSAGSSTRAINRSNGSFVAYNCTLHGPGSVGIGVNSNSGGTIKGCAVFDWSDDFAVTSGTIAYCASDDGDGTNAQSGATWANEFEGYTTGDFRVKSGSTKLKDLGVTDPGAGLFSDDIVGTSRPQGSAWDIGAHEYIVTTSLTDVDTDETILAGQSSIAYTGTGLASADQMLVKTGTKNAAGTSFAAGGATSGTFTAPTAAAIRSAGVKFGACTFDIRASGVSLATLAGTINPSSGLSVHDVTDISQAADSGCLYYGHSPAVAVGDQVLFDSVTATNGWAIAIDAQGFVTISSGGSEAQDSVTYYVWDATDETWGAAGTWTINNGAGRGVRAVVRKVLRPMIRKVVRPAIQFLRR